jgi:hypothetical protein
VVYATLTEKVYEEFKIESAILKLQSGSLSRDECSRIGELAVSTMDIDLIAKSIEYIMNMNLPSNAAFKDFPKHNVRLVLWLRYIDLAKIEDVSKFDKITSLFLNSNIPSSSQIYV